MILDNLNIFISDNSKNIDYLKQCLNKNYININNISNFNSQFINELPERSRLARLVEKIVSMITSLIKPLSHTGLASRKTVLGEPILQYSSTQNTALSEGFVKENNFNNFNIGPPVPYYRLQLGDYQRSALIDLLDKDSNDLSLQSLAAKYLKNKYTLAELSVEERAALNKVNFQATQTYFKDMIDVLNDPNSNINKYAQLQNQQKTYHYKKAMIAEVLSKSLAYNSSLGVENNNIELPVEINRSMQLVNYTIEKKYLGEKLPFYVLKPDPSVSQEIKEHAQPWVVIRGTEPLLTDDKEGARESIAADVKDSQGVSALPIWQRASELLSILSNVKEESGQKINITGHSLGGTLAQSMAVIYNPLVDETFAFNSPGVDKNIHDCAMQLDQQVRNNIVVFHRSGDIVSSASPKRIGKNFEISNLSGREQEDAFVKHSDIMLNAPHFQAQVDINRDEKSLMRRFSDWNRRKILSKISYLVVDANQFGWFQKRRELRDFASRYLEEMKRG